MASGKQQVSSIINPHDHDVLSGRGNFVNYHAGNEHFRGLVRKHKVEYVQCPKPQKGKFSRMIVEEVKSLNPPGRFLKQDMATKLWYDVGEKKSVDKTRQALREGAPEIMEEVNVGEEDDSGDEGVDHHGAVNQFLPPESSGTHKTNKMTDKKANIALIGAGWWSQGWHLPCLDRSKDVNLVAIVDTSSHPKSNLNPDLESLETLKQKYHTKIFSDTKELLNEMGPELDGVLIATPHATHYAIGKVFMEEIDRRKEQGETKPLHILMEKPMSTDVQDSLLLYKLVKDHAGPSQFWINHSANFRTQAKMARDVISSGKIGKVRHITGFFASPLMWIFDDPTNKGWNEPSGDMLGNGFAWGQMSHLLAWIYHVCPNLQPVDVYCNMMHSEKTGADVSLSATIRCYDGSNSKELAVMNVSGTSLLPGNAHSEPPVGKVADIKIFGTEGSLFFGGDDREPNSGRLELRRPDGSTEVLHEDFHFENLDADGLGPESLQAFVQLCCGSKDVYAGANVMDGLRSIQTIDAMYRSHDSSGPVNVKLPE